MTKQQRSLLIDKRAIIESQKFSLVCNQNERQIKELLVFIFALIGITGSNLPSNYQEKIIVSYIRNHLSKYTTQDFKIAFLLGLKGKLDFNIQSFQNFNPLYIENVMQSFNRYRFNIINDNKQKLRQKKTEITPQEKEKLNKEAAIKFIKTLFEGKSCLDVGYVIVYNYLKKNEKLLLSDKRKKEISQEAIVIQNHIMENNSTRHMGNGDMRKAKEAFNKPNNIEVIKKKIAVQDYFKNAKELDITLDEIIK